MEAAALQLVHIAADKIHPVRNDPGKIKTFPVFLKGFRCVLGNQDGQARTGVQVVCLPAQDHCLGKAPLHFGRSFRIKLGISVQRRAQVHHIPAAIRKGTKGIHAAAAATDGGNVAVLDLAGHCGGELFHTGFQLAHGGQLHRAEGQVIIRVIVQALLDKAFDNAAAQLFIRKIRILLQHIQPAGIIPARSGFQLLTGYIVINAVMGKHGSHFIGGHHTGVTAENVDMIAGNFPGQLLQRAVDLHNSQTVIICGFVKADAAFRSGAVIPQHGDRPVRRVLRQAVTQKFHQAVRAAHGSLSPVLQFFKISVTDYCQRPAVALQVLQGPFFRAAGQHYHVDGVPGFHFSHLHQVFTCVFLQIRSAHIDQQRGRFSFSLYTAQGANQRK